MPHRIFFVVSGVERLIFFVVLRYKVFGCGDEVLGESKPISSVFFVLSGRICVFQPGCCKCCRASALPAGAAATTNLKKNMQCACVPVFRSHSVSSVPHIALSASHQTLVSAGGGFIAGELAMVQGSHRSAHTYTAVGRQARPLRI